MNNRIARRDFLKSVSAVTLAGASASLAGAAASTSPQPLEEFDYGDVRLTGGPLKRQYDRIHAAYLALDNDRLLRVYRLRAGLPAPGAEMGGWYGAGGFIPGHSLGQYISGLARFGSATGDPDCKAKAAALVGGFAATLGPGSRIYAGPNAEKIWPCYVLDKHLAGLIDAHRLAEVTQARELLCRVFRGALPYIPEQGRDRAGKKDPPYDETYVLPENLFSAFEITGERAMFRRAQAYLLDREFFDPLARGEDVLPGRHAYSHVIALGSAAKARLVLGDEKYLRVMQTAWNLLTTTQQYATGGWGPNETFITPCKGELYASLHTTEDHFETPCGSYAAIKLARYLLCATADGRYGDGLERVVYNAILAVKQPDSDGDYPYYSTYSDDARKTYYAKKWPCCSGTLVQGVADYVKNIYFKAPDGIAVNLYAPSEGYWIRNGTPLKLIQTTDYPLDDAITLRIDCAVPVDFTLRLRIPAWLRGPALIKVNGKPAAPDINRGFAKLRRTWRKGDTVTLTLEQTFRTEAIDDLHPDTVAVLRGPLVYVELNPPSGSSHLAPLARMRPLAGADGAFSVSGAERERVLVPIYLVRDETYTTYFTG
ncbi:MAG: beta-L-arabinofuranosidase domain-containing protein [Terracidiphilus sp.]